MAKEKKSRFGTDLMIAGEEVFEDGELRVRNDLFSRNTGDLSTVGGKDNIIQAIRHRLSTRKGELTELGHPNYGSLLHEMIGQPNTEGTRAIIETLDLLRPIYKRTAAYGHFGRTEESFPWEELNRTEALKAAL